MAVNLTLPAQDVDIAAPAYARLSEKLQANILKPHGRDVARHIFLRFTADAAAVRSWIKTQIAPKVTDTASQYQQSANRAATNADGGVVCGFFLSAAGYKHLGLDPRRFGSEVFKDGMKEANDSLGERVLGTTSKDPKPETWQGSFQGVIHALVTVADDHPGPADAAEAQIVASCAGVATVLVVEKGKVLRRNVPAGGRDGEPIEHFGYLDGLSNPRFTKRDLAKNSQVDGTGAKWDVGAPLNLVLFHDPFVDEEDAFGSFLVYRKLAQDVDLFNKRVVALASELGLKPDLAGALVVGRFKDGTPVATSAEAGGALTNDFDFKGADSIARCPAHAHIRKVNPRGTTPLTSLKGERKRRIVRRGIPYGDPLSGAAGDAPDAASGADERGLLFMCFQHDIEEQFEFIQHTWVDNEEFPSGLLPFQKDTGDDPLIGQVRESGQRWPKKWGDEDAGRKRVTFESAVTLKGGEYFFAPSLPFLRTL